MVYTGRPSTGCQRCRERRKKCDETRPQCQNCTRLGKECPGYPDQLDTMFRNETAVVTQRATRRRRQKGTPSRKASESPNASSNQGQDTATRSSTLTNIEAAPTETKSGGDEVSLSEWQATKHSQSIENQAISYFSTHYISQIPNQESPLSIFDAASAVLETATDDSPLRKAFEAVAVRALATDVENKEFYDHAKQLYGKAIRGIHQVLGDDVEATSDDTLLSILLLTAYETVCSRNIDNWSKHIQGAVSIVNARGVSQFASPRSLLLFRTTRAHVLMNALLHCQSTPELSGSEGWLADANTTSPVNCHMQLPNVLAKAKTLLLDTSTPSRDEIESLLSETYDLQNGLYQTEISLPSNYSYRSALNVDALPDKDTIITSPIWPGPVHVYPNVHIACVRNTLRVVQLLASNVVVAALKRLDGDEVLEDRRFKAVKYRIQYLVDDIAASVPFQLGDVEPDESGGKGKAPGQEQAATGSSLSGPYLLIWPLYISSQMPTIPDTQRKWIVERLLVILERYGIQNVDLTRAREGSSRWPTDQMGNENCISSLAKEVARAHIQCLDDAVTQRTMATLAEKGFAARYAEEASQE